MTETLAASFGAGAIKTGQRARDWREAIELAGQALHESKRCESGYAAAMVAAVEEYGPYIVVAPGIALAHARPSELVLETGLSLVGLAEPVVFGHAENDPVSLVFGLCAVDHDSHLAVLAELADFLSESQNAESLRGIERESEIRSLFRDWPDK